MQHWFYRSVESATHGPIGPSELLELIRGGVINENTLIRKGDSAWVRSVEVNGLWQAAGRPSAAFDCPQCGKPIPKPPVRCSHCQQFVTRATGHLVHHKIGPPTSLPDTRDNADGLNSKHFGSQPGLYD